MSGTDGEPPAPASRRGTACAELIAERRAKGERLKQADAELFPYSFEAREPIAGDRSTPTSTSRTARRPRTPTASPAAWRRAAARAARRFWTSSTAAARSSCTRARDVLGEEAFERLTSLDLGDLIGVDGAVLRSRRGEISLRVDGFRGARQGAAPAAGQARTG